MTPAIPPLTQDRSIGFGTVEILEGDDEAVNSPHFLCGPVNLNVDRYTVTNDWKCSRVLW